MMFFGVFIRVRKVRWMLASQELGLSPLEGSRWITHVGLFRDAPVIKSFDLVTVSAGSDDVIHWVMRVGDVEHVGSEVMRAGDKFVMTYSSRVGSTEFKGGV